MNILRGVGRWLLALSAALLITLWISLSILQTTILNRTVVLGWLQDSGLYQTALDSVIDLQETGQALVTKTEIKQALKATFPPDYLRQHTEVIIHATYDWVESKESAIVFTIPIEQKRAEFSANLAKVVEPKLAALPPCKTRINPDANNPTCIPQGMTAADMAKQMTQLGEGGEFLAKPLTADSFKGNQKPDIPTAWIPSAVANLKWLLFVLPTGALLAATAYVFLSDNRLKGLSTISRRIFLNGLLLVVAGGLVWFFGRNVNVEGVAADLNGGALINPLLQQILPTMGQALVLTAGAIGLVSGLVWVATIVWRRRQQPSPARFDHPRELPKPPAQPTIHQPQ